MDTTRRRVHDFQFMNGCRFHGPIVMGRLKNLVYRLLLLLYFLRQGRGGSEKSRNSFSGDDPFIHLSLAGCSSALMTILGYRMR